jgi:hypothetical protein
VHWAGWWYCAGCGGAEIEHDPSVSESGGANRRNAQALTGSAVATGTELAV